MFAVWPLGSFSEVVRDPLADVNHSTDKVVTRTRTHIHTQVDFLLVLDIWHEGT